MLIGYARVSTDDQHLDLQIDALNQIGCEKIITDEISGATDKREGLDKLKELLREGDTLVVWRLDRLSRSLKHLIEWINYLESIKVSFKSLHESIDTSTTSGKLVFHIFGALSEFERNLIRERTNAGLKAARARGKIGGRKFKLNDDAVSQLKDLYHSKKYPIKDMCKTFNITRSTLYSYIKV